LNSTETWKKGKKHAKHDVQSISRPRGPKDGAGWHARFSQHKQDDGTWQDFWDGLAVDKAVKEAQ
jgi:hypothetical protein